MKNIFDVEIGEVFEFQGRTYLKLAEDSIIPYFGTIEEFYASLDDADVAH